MSADDAARRSALQRALFEGQELDPEWANDPQLDELREVERLLHSASARERSELIGEDTAPDGPALSRPRLKLLPVWIAAAAALLVVLWRFAPDRGVREEFPLGPTAITLVAPRGEVASFGEFKWTGELPPGGSFELLIWRADAGPLESPLVRRTLDVSSWTPDAGDLPAAIRWEVRGLGPGGEILGSASGSVRTTP